RRPPGLPAPRHRQRSDGRQPVSPRQPTAPSASGSAALRSLSPEAVAQTPAVQISYQDLTSAIRRFESNHASRVVDSSPEPSDDVGPELIDARLCALYNAPPLCDSLA